MDNNWKEVVKVLGDSGIEYQIEIDAGSDDVTVVAPSLKARIITGTDGFIWTPLANEEILIRFNPFDATETAFFLQALFHLVMNVPLGRRNEDELIESLKRDILGGIVEFTEVLSTFAWKSHKPKGYTKFDLESLIEECADVYIYLINIPMELGIDPKKFMQAVINKQGVNIQRILKNREKEIG